VVLSWPDYDSCESKHVAITTVKSNYLLFWPKFNKLNTLTEQNGMNMLKVKISYICFDRNILLDHLCVLCKTRWPNTSCSDPSMSTFDWSCVRPIPITKCRTESLPSYLWLHNRYFNPLTPKSNPSAQRCLMNFLARDFTSWTVHFNIIFVKNQQMQQLFIQFINYVW
jgi:hypothetical protein